MGFLSEFFTNEILIKTLVASLVALVLILCIGFSIIFISIVIRVAQKAGGKKKASISVEDLGHKLEGYSMHVKRKIFAKKEFGKIVKTQQKKQKDLAKKNVHGPVVFVIDFEGDVQASQVKSLREEISTILEVADAKKDEVVVRLESRGGVVHGYGLAASQLKRIRDHKIPLVACIDKVAASGGYMMACIANKILAAPFAIVGSIGVVSQVPNFHRFLKSKDIDYEEMTAGEYKRTVSTFGEISEKGRQKHLKDLENIHGLFKKHVQDHRPSLDISKVSTGEYWYGTQAQSLGLIDDIISSDDYIAQALKNHKKVYKIKLNVQKNFLENLSQRTSSLLSPKKAFQQNTPPYDMEKVDEFPHLFT